MKENIHDDLIFVGYTNGMQIIYANDTQDGGEGYFYKDNDCNCCIPLYMLKTHWHRLESTSNNEVNLERLQAAQKS